MKRFIYISAADFGVINYLLQGYYDGKVFNDRSAGYLNLMPSESTRIKPGFKNVNGKRSILSGSST